MVKMIKMIMTMIIAKKNKEEPYAKKVKKKCMIQGEEERE